jgi:hypothetical protein
LSVDSEPKVCTIPILVVFSMDSQSFNIVSAAEAAVVQGIDVYPAHNLREVAEFSRANVSCTRFAKIRRRFSSNSAITMSTSSMSRGRNTSSGRWRLPRRAATTF